MKKMLSLILVAVMLVAALPLSVSAAETGYVTFDAAVEVGRTGSSATIDLYFSEPVHFVLSDKYIAKLCNRYLTSPGSSNPSDWQHYAHNNDDSIYLNPQTGKDGKLYSDVIRLTFSKGSDATPSVCTSDRIIPITGPAGIRLMENYTNQAAYDGVLDTASVVGISGNPVKSTHNLDSKNEMAWVDLNRLEPALLDVQFDGWNATLTFSRPITFVNLANAIRCCRDYQGSLNPQYQPLSATYLGEVTEKDGAQYSKVVRVAFRNTAGYIAGASHGFTPKYSDLGVRLMEFVGGDGENGTITKANIVGLNGYAVAGTHQASKADITFMQASAVRPLAEFVKAEVIDPADFTVNLTFTKPIHIHEKTGFKLTWDYNPSEKAEGHYQFQAKDVTYVDPTVIDGLEYSTTIRMSFTPTGGYTEIPTNAGIRIVEYNQESDWGNCSVSPIVATDTEGLPIAVNKQVQVRSEATAWVDIAWQTMTFSGTTTTLLGAQMVEENAVLVDFSRPVSLNDISGITVAGVAAQSAVSASGEERDNQWKITFAQALSTENKATIVFATTSMLDAYGCGLLTPAEALLDPWQDENIEYGEDFSDELDLTKPYHFMNADTGRSLTVGGTEEWILVPVDGGNNMYALSNGVGQYLDLTGSTPVLSNYPGKLLLRKGVNDRYQIVVGGNKVLADGDGGQTAAIALTRLVESRQDISTGWYLTKSGDTRPLRVMPLGDSITFGVNQDLASSELRVSYRAQLSQDLTEYFGRVVFVGSEVTATTTLSETRLLRHAGFPGYVVTDIWGEDGHPGVDEQIDGLCSKYAPDVVLLMLGTNDLSRMVNAGTTTDEDLVAQIGRYEAFVNTIDSFLDERGTIVCSSLTPRAEGANVALKQTMVSTYNGLIEEMVDELAAEGKKIVFNDNYAAVSALGDAGLCSDKLHLSLAGSAALAEQYYRTVTAHYGTGSLKFSSLQTALDQNDKVVLTQDYTVDDLIIPIDTTLDLNGYTVTASQVSAVTSTSSIMDATEGNGGIEIAKNDKENKKYYLQLVKDNGMLPLYDSVNGCYRFFTATTTHLQKAGDTSDSYKFGFQVDMADAAYALLKDAANADIALKTTLVVTVDGVEKVNKPYAFTAETLGLYATRKLEDTGNWAVTLTVNGFDSIDGNTIVITSTPQVVSSTGVSVVPTTDQTRTYQYTRTGA